MDCLVLCDDVDCQEFLLEISKQLLEMHLKPRLVLRQHFSSVIAKSKHLPPFILLRESVDRIENIPAVINFHRKNPSFAMIKDQQGEILSINPALVELSGALPSVNDSSKIFSATNARLVKKLLPTKPPHIIVLSHNRDIYLTLTLNSLLFSLQPHISDVPITLALSNPTEAVIECAKRFQATYPSIEVLIISENTHMATPLYILQYLEIAERLPETFMIFEDDFILPSSVKDLYPNWPWWFALRLKTNDMVAWLPSFDNCPTAVNNYIDQHNITINRNIIPGSRWLTNQNNLHLALSGNAVACNTALYKLCAKRSNFGYPVDTELSALVANASCPTIFGYHIGWNQEQDGFSNLAKRTWPPVPKVANIADLRTKTSMQIKL